MPSANDLIYKNKFKKIKSYPLNYYWCSDCSLVQQLKLVERQKLFSDYTYMTGVNKQTVDLYKKEAIMLKKKFSNRKFAIVIASNDGTEINLIKNIAKFDKVIGVEPAKNMAKIANAQNLETINDFFTYKLSKKILNKYGKADLIVANNVFAHIPNPKDMLKGMKTLLSPSGMIEIEVHWLKYLVDELQIDILYAEHYYEWTLKAMTKIATKSGLKVISSEPLPNQQGGSIRFWLGLKGKENHKIMAEEEKAGLYSIKKMKNLQRRADKKKYIFRSMIQKIKSKGKRIGIWSVPAKIVTILNFCNITGKDIDYAYEVAPTKINKYIPKANILIKDEKSIIKDMPDYLIIGAWNYIDFAQKSLSAYTKKGGKLINPLTCRLL